MTLPFLEKKKFILVIGDDGAILSLIDQNKVEKRLFALSAALSDRREFHSLLTKYPTIPIYVMLDTMEQSYTKQTLPAVGSMAIGKLVKKRLDRDFAASDIKGAIHLGRDETGRKDWIYMFASAPITPSIAEWIDYIALLENKFTGIYMLPIEMENFVKNFRKTAAFEKKEVPQWQFLLTNNKTGGFRQIILHHGKVIFTRLIRPGKDVMPDIVAGNIEQEILNTIDYMRRLSFSDEDDIEIIAIVSSELKKSLTNTKIRNQAINIFTPFETANALGLKDVVGNEDKFADLVIAANFANSNAILKLESPKMSKVNALLTFNVLSTTAMMAIAPIMMLYMGYITFEIIRTNSAIGKLEDEKAGIERKWKDARKTDEYSIDDSNKIADAISLHKKLAKTISPLDLIAKSCATERNYALTKSLTWTYDKQQAVAVGQEPPKQIEKAVLNFDFLGAGQSPEELFKNFDIFRAGLKKELAGYKVEITDLPDTITFDDKTKLIPIQVKIEADETAAAAAATATPPAATPPVNN
jgi:hypothetical protein